ncbi:hypothetical protein [Streptomyces tropicalis]|uniref:Uncharacterized protein n=1 Tax=Streptomyces tropicalis TaxID=3034234 RepID=A0ABT6ADI3_9ACTN|nr:hypothetical protein [Streptomyces tropicalis]MDF3302482.1 hypothetical protein [Streptomyces tropicalis]
MALTAVGTDLGNSAIAQVKSLFGDDHPLVVNVSSVTTMRVTGGGTVIFPGPVPRTPQQLASDVNSLNGPGVLPDAVATQVKLTNAGDATAYITDITLHKTCTAPLTGTIVYDPPQGNGGGSTDVVDIGFDLDSPHPPPQNFNPDSLQLSGNYFLGHTVAIVKGAPQTLVLLAKTSRHYCRYSYEITLDGEKDQTATKTVPSTKGRSLQVTANLIGDHSPRPLTAYQRAYVPGYQAGPINVGTGAGTSANASSSNSLVQVNPKKWKPYTAR